MFLSWIFYISPKLIIEMDLHLTEWTNSEDSLLFNNSIL